MFKIFFTTTKERLKEYLVFVLSLQAAVTVYYVFAALRKNSTLMYRLSQDYPLEPVLGFANLCIVTLLFFFLMMAFPFFLEGQKKDLKTFIFLGVKKSQLLFYLALGQVFLLGVAFVAGIVTGAFLSKIFGQLLARLMDQRVGIPFLISWPAVGQTFWLFLGLGLILALKSAFSLLRLEEGKPEKKAKKSHEKCYQVQGILGFLGLALIGLGYTLAAKLPFFFFQKTDGWLQNLSLFLPFISLLLCVVGTFLLGELSQFFLRFLRKKSQFYYKKLHAIAMGNLKNQVQQAGNTLAVIAILSGFAFSFLGGASALQNLSQQIMQQESPVDFQVAKESLASFKETLAAEKVAIKKEITASYKLVGVDLAFSYNGKPLGEDSHTVTNLISVSQYNLLRKVNPRLRKLPHLTHHEAIFLGNNQIFQNLREIPKQVPLLQGEKLQIKEVFPDRLGNVSLRYGWETLVVADAIFNQTPGISYETVSIVTDANELSKEQMASIIQKVAQDFEINWLGSVAYDFTSPNEKDWVLTLSDKPLPNTSFVQRLNFTSLYLNRRAFKAEVGLLYYLSLFLGILFFIVTGSILMLRQLHLAKSNRKTYALLRLLGADENWILRNVYLENALMFFLPLLLGLSHAYFALKVFYYIFPAQQQLLSWVLWGGLLALYSVFYFYTSHHYYRWLKK